jgi:hypothetical protein
MRTSVYRTDSETTVTTSFPYSAPETRTLAIEYAGIGLEELENLLEMELSVFDDDVEFQVCNSTETVGAYIAHFDVHVSQLGRLQFVLGGV